MVPLVVYFAGSLFGETGCQVMLERIFFNPGQLIFSLSSKKCLNCYNMWGHVWENIIFILYIVSTFGCFGKFQAFFGFQMRSLVQSDWSQFHWISLFWKGPSLPNIFDLPFKVFPSSNNKSFRWEWFTYCTEFSSSVVREISHGSPISVRGPLQRRDRVEKVCLPCFGQRKMNIWKEHLSCG